MKRVLVYGMTNNPGGVEAYIINVSKRLDSKELIFDFVTDFPDIAYRELLQSSGSRIFFIPPKGRHLFLHLIRMYKLLKDHAEYETVYFNLLDAGGAITELVPFLLKRRIVTHSHNGSTDKKVLHCITRPLLIALSQAYVACSHKASEFMFGRKIAESGKVLIVPNAIDAARFAYNVEIRKNTRHIYNLEDKLVLCHIGRITHQKNPYGLLDIFEQVCLRHPDSHLLYIGTGEWEKDIRNYAASKHLTDKISFLGVRNDVSNLLQGSDIFLLPSFYEGLPIALIEAQASGLPCIISDVISRESICTNLVVTLSTDASPEVWASHILDYVTYDRHNTLEELRKAHLDLSTFDDIASQLQLILNYVP